MDIKLGGETIKIRALTRQEVRALKDVGFSLAMASPELSQADEAMDRVLALVLTDDDIAFLETRPLHESLMVWKEILKETYGDPDAEKNLNGTSAG